jgi:hypothetical protein
MIDDEKLHWGSLRFQLQPKLLLDGRQERWAVGIWLIRGRQVCRTRRELVRTGKPRQVDVVFSSFYYVVVDKARRIFRSNWPAEFGLFQLRF